ncbi:MAG: hypothetical protein Q7V57_02325 [Actinomycetota bacterium]|nr:hypothetical protein [Actinomycetota bacterium]
MRTWSLAKGAVVAAAVCTLVTQFLLYFRWLAHYANEDQTLLWAAARDWGHVRPRQPNFWGQDYSTTFEAIPAALFHGLGLSYGSALTLAVLLLNLAAWFALGFAAWRLGRPMLAVLAFGAIAAMSVDHAVLTIGYNTAAPRALLAVAAATLLLVGRHRWLVVGALSLALLTLCWDASGLLLFAPMVFYAVARHRPRPAQWRFLLAALVAIGAPTVAWLQFTSAWYDRHPEDAMHAPPTLEPGWSRLVHNLSTPNKFFGAFGSALWVSWLVPAAVVVLLLVVALRRNDRLALVSVLSVVGVTFLILSVPRAAEALDTPYLPNARTLLPLPMALVFCAAILRPAIRPAEATGSASSERSVRGGQLRVAVAVAAPLIGLLGLVVAWQQQAGELKDKAIAYSVYPQRRNEVLDDLCGRVQTAADAHHVDTVVFDLKVSTYACAALGTHLVTVYPQYERRSWVLRTFLDHPDEPFIFVSELDDQVAVDFSQPWCQVIATGQGFENFLLCTPDELVWRIDLLNYLNQPVRTTF